MLEYLRPTGGAQVPTRQVRLQLPVRVAVILAAGWFLETRWRRTAACAALLVSGRWRERTPAGVDGRSRRARFLRVLWTVLHRQRLMSEAAAKEVSATAPGV